MKKTTIGIMTLTASIIGITCFLTINTNAEKADTTEEKKFQLIPFRLIIL